MATEIRVSQQVILYAVPTGATIRVAQQAILHAIPSHGLLRISQQVVLYIKGHGPGDGSCPVPNAFGVADPGNEQACAVANTFGAE